MMSMKAEAKPVSFVEDCATNYRFGRISSTHSIFEKYAYRHMVNMSLAVYMCAKHEAGEESRQRIAEEAFIW